MCAGDPKRALNYLRTTVSEAIDHTDSAQVRALSLIKFVYKQIFNTEINFFGRLFKIKLQIIRYEQLICSRNSNMQI